MTRLTIPSRENAPAKSQPLLDAVEKQLGIVPNLFRLVATSPAALEGFLGLNGAMGRTLDAKTRERIALAIAQANGCDYCLSAHTYLGLNLAQIDETEIALNRAGHSGDAKADAAVVFARKVLEARGRVSDADLAEVRLAGFSEAQVIEIVAAVALNVFTNYVNNVAETDIDFPVVRAAQAA
ncbi:carboxymuconolactone decarboxylase family protein [Novosphingobium sp. Gsoil 351]|uniref:carboxymuconolactone decarboxylase family protein n=1 Tax=Novosphingobium sp. Gsoil 351 TaxID=2675225 RepID=UPI0012B4FA3E|nr:carboxymuconolactone decarboxylase family protein [Novosphingobium sp. Gsoil 351]QGN54113.1 carboxymuconolactone decarboxylase family protein [Novosphingobium sp. Gsoil 351]